jgi:hypothetical protein
MCCSFSRTRSLCPFGPAPTPSPLVPRYDTLLELVRTLNYDLIMVPRALVPVVQALVRDHRNDRPGEGEERSLYAADGGDQTTQEPRDEV